MPRFLPIKDPALPPSPAVASSTYAALDLDLQALIFLSFLWRLGACLAAIGGPLWLLHLSLRCALGNVAPEAYLALRIGEGGVLVSASIAALWLAFRWHHQSRFGPYEVQFISRGGENLYPKA